MKMYALRILFLFMAVTMVAGGWWRRTKKSASVGVKVKDGKPTFEGKLTISFRKKRDADITQEHHHETFNVELRKCVTLDPCKMTSYDEDQDGVITWEEIEDIFSDSDLYTAFFADADTNEDGKLTQDEFTEFSKYIKGCQQ